MKIEFERAARTQVRALMAFDAKVFRAADRFDRAMWRECEAWWMRLGARKVGCAAFVRDLDFCEDVRADRFNVRRKGSLYIATTGILPKFQRLGLGSLFKAWQVSYARYHGFDRMITNTRKSNAGMIALNQKFGFKVLRVSADYYRSPKEATVVMELTL